MPFRILALLICFALATTAEETDYPCWRGPTGNGAAADSGLALITAADQAKRIWTCEQELQEGYVGAGWGYRGTYAQPILAADRLYVPYWEPVGSHLATAVFAEAQSRKSLPEAHRNKERWLVDADDLLLCVDARSGEVVWRARCPGGLNHSGDNPPPVHMAACYENGRVYFCGTGGLANCIDAANGTVLWQTPIPGAAERWNAVRERCRREGTLPGKQRGGYALCANPCLAAGVLVVHDGGRGLVGIDATSGRLRWGPVENVNGHRSSPMVWRHAGGAAVIAVDADSCSMSCLDPSTGKLLWRAQEVYAAGSPCIAGDLVLVGGDVRKIKHKFGRNKHGYEGDGISAWRLTAAGAEKTWALPLADRVAEDCTPCVWDGHAYACVMDAEPGRKSDKRAMLCIEIATGTVVARVVSDGGYASLVCADGRLVQNVGRHIELWDADPTSLRRLGRSLDASCADSITPILVGGILFARGVDRLSAYDLRR